MSYEVLGIRKSGGAATGRLRPIFVWAGKMVQSVDNLCLFAEKCVSLYCKEYHTKMEEKINLNSYRLTGVEEPSDELLAALMKKVAEEASRKRHQARTAYFKHAQEYSNERMEVWKKRIEQAKACGYEQ